MHIKVTRTLFDDYRQGYDLEIDGDHVFDVWEGEPEDMTLGRNLQCVQDIPTLLRKAYEAGKAGQSFSVENVEVDET